jgi:hypothetical protein
MDYFEISEPTIYSKHTGCFPVLFILENHGVQSGDYFAVLEFFFSDV